MLTTRSPERSISEIMRIAVIRLRRSPAIGCCRASTLVAALLDLEGEGVERVVAVDELLRRRRGRRRGGPAVPRGSASVTMAAMRHDVVRIVVELLVEGLAESVSAMVDLLSMRSAGRRSTDLGGEVAGSPVSR